MSSNLFGIFLSMNLLVAQKKIVNIPLDHQCTGTEFLFCVTRGILFRLASPYSEKKAFWWPVHFKLKHPPWLGMKKGKKWYPFLGHSFPTKQKFAHLAWTRLCTEKNQTFFKWNLSRFRKTSPKVDDVFPLKNVPGIFEYLVPPNSTEEHSAKKQVF